MQKYCVGDRVIYGCHGVCTIIAIERQKSGANVASYYVLSPKDGQSTRYYVPTHNENAVAKLSHILSAQQIHQLLSSDAVKKDVWIDDEAKRKQHYKALITANDRAELICMIRCLHKHKANQLQAGKKFHMCDENFLRDAQRLLAGEFAAALGIQENQVESVILSYM